MAVICILAMFTFDVTLSCIACRRQHNSVKYSIDGSLKVNTCHLYKRTQIILYQLICLTGVCVQLTTTSSKYVRTHTAKLWIGLTYKDKQDIPTGARANPIAKNTHCVIIKLPTKQWAAVRCDRSHAYICQGNLYFTSDYMCIVQTIYLALYIICYNIIQIKHRT